MKSVLPWLVRWASRAGTIDFCPALNTLVSPVTKYYFPHRTLFHFIRPHRPATWVGSRAGSPACLVLGPCVRLHYFSLCCLLLHLLVPTSLWLIVQLLINYFFISQGFSVVRKVETSFEIENTVQYTSC